MEKNNHIELCGEHHHHLADPAQIIPPQEIITPLAELFKTFGDPTGSASCTLFPWKNCVCDIADSLGMTQSAISHQLRILKQMQLVKFRRDGKTVFYSLSDSHVSTILAQGLEHIKE